MDLQENKNVRVRRMGIILKLILFIIFILKFINKWKLISAGISSCLS